MIDRREILETIEKIKRNGNTISQAERLALLYIAADYMEREEGSGRESDVKIRGYSQAAEPLKRTIDVEAKSEFLEACNGVDIEDALEVIDEHMEAIRVLYPKEYNAVVNRIEEMKKGG